MSEAGPLRLFLDSNVLTGGIVAPWGLDKAVLSLCAARICRFVLAEIVRQEVEENLLHHATVLPSQDAEQVLEDYATLLTLARPELVPLPDAEVVMQARSLNPPRGRCSRLAIGHAEPSRLATDTQHSAFYPGCGCAHWPPDRHPTGVLPGPRS